MTTTEPVKWPVGCTCVGCPATGSRILHHVFQSETWESSGEYVPCDDADCWLNCSNNASQEDLLCDRCREQGGISKMDVARLTAILTERDKPVIETDVKSAYPKKVIELGRNQFVVWTGPTALPIRSNKPFERPPYPRPPFEQ